MKLEKWQWIAILLLVFFHFNGSVIKPDFKPDLTDEELESKAMAGMLVLTSNGRTVPIVPDTSENQSGQEPVFVEETRPEVKNIERDVWSGRPNRVILLTDTRNCAPCIIADRNIVDRLRKSKDWTVGKKDTNSCQVIDLSKDPELFWQSVEKIKKSDRSYLAMTPTFVKLGKNGTILKIQSGITSLSAFNTFVTENTDD